MSLPVTANISTLLTVPLILAGLFLSTSVYPLVMLALLSIAGIPISISTAKTLTDNIKIIVEIINNIFFMV
ncbi:hypothetical protein ES708_04681 [subsurface metagenome]